MLSSFGTLRGNYCHPVDGVCIFNFGSGKVLHTHSWEIIKGDSWKTVWVAGARHILSNFGAASPSAELSCLFYFSPVNLACQIDLKRSTLSFWCWN